MKICGLHPIDIKSYVFIDYKSIISLVAYGSDYCFDCLILKVEQNNYEKII